MGGMNVRGARVARQLGQQLLSNVPVIAAFIPNKNAFSLHVNILEAEFVGNTAGRHCFSKGLCVKAIGVHVGSSQVER